jgi:hypothetical protein
LLEVQKKNAGPDGVVGLAAGVRGDNKVIRIKVQETPGWVSNPSTQNKDFKAIEPLDEPITGTEGNTWQEAAREDPRSFKPAFNADLSVMPLKRV